MTDESIFWNRLITRCREHVQNNHAIPGEWRPSEFELFGLQIPQSEAVSQAEMMDILCAAMDKQTAASAQSSVAENGKDEPHQQEAIRAVFLLAMLKVFRRSRKVTLGNVSAEVDARQIDFTDLPAPWSARFPWIDRLTIEPDESDLVSGKVFYKVRMHLQAVVQSHSGIEQHSGELQITLSDDAGHEDTVILKRDQRVGKFIHVCFTSDASRLVVRIVAVPKRGQQGTESDIRP